MRVLNHIKPPLTYAVVFRPLLLLCLLVLPFLGFTQDDHMVIFHGKTSPYGSSAGMGDVKVTLLDNGSKLEEQITSSNGKYEFEVPVGGNYTLKFSRSGWVSKYVTINTTGVHEEDAYSFDMKIDMELFEEIPDLDVSILDQPIGKATWDPGVADIVWDMAYTEDIQDKLEKLMKEAEKKLEEMEEAAAEEAARLAEMQENYNDAVSSGDSYLSSGKYEQAIAEYQAAMDIFDDDSDTVLKHKIEDAQEKLDELAANEAVNAEYQKLIDQADDLMSSTDYTDAIARYEEALQVKDEQYPKDQITKANNLIAQAEANAVEEEYNAFIAEANNAFNDKDYGYAKAQYQAALGVKPGESFPQERIDEIDGIIAADLEKEQLFNDLMSQGGNLLVAKKYDDAIAKYEEAAQVKPDNSEPAEKIEEAKRLKAENNQQLIDEQYYGIISEADKAYDNQDYEGAMGLYQDALEVKEEDYPQNQINDIKELLAELADNEMRYNEFINKGDKALNGGDYEEAIVQYEGALGVRSSEQYPKDQIEEANRLMAQAEQDAIDAEYDALLAKADNAFGAEDYENAVGFYNEALDVKDEQYPKDKIEEIEGILADLEAAALATEEAARIQEEYDAMIVKADDAFDDDDYESARDFYTDAKGIKSDETYPDQRISEIDGILDQLAAEEAAAAELAAKQEEYDNLMAEAEDQFDAEDYADARSNYVAASNIFPDEKEPKDRIDEIDGIIGELAAEQARLDELNAEYDGLITAADNLFDTKDYEGAKAKYEQALDLKEDEPYPADQINEIDDLLAQLEAAAEAQAALQAEYDEWIEKAEKAYAAEEWEDALASFEEAHDVKESETYPTEKIDEIKGILDQLAADARAQADAEALQAEYDELIEEADAAYDDEDYDLAVEKYEDALDVIPTEEYPVDQIDKINQLQTQLASQAEAAAIQAEYDELIEKADDAYDDEDYTAAIGYYESAHDVITTEDYPVDQINKINQLLDQLASQADLEARQAEYDQYIEEADDAFNRELYTEAIDKYQKAYDLISTDPYPQDQIDLINARIAEEQAANMEAEQLAAMESEYDSYIEEADQAFDAGNYEVAKSNYQKATGVFNDRKYPKERVSEIDDILARLANEEQAALLAEQQKEIDDRYNEIIEEADAFFNDESYESAKGKYKEALTVKQAKYPQERIDQIDGLLAAADAAAQQEQQQADYDKYLNSGNTQFSKGNYDVAKSLYGQAQSAMNTPEIQDKLAEIDQILNGTSTTTTNTTNTTNTTTTNTTSTNTTVSNTTASGGSNTGNNNNAVFGNNDRNYGNQVYMTEQEIADLMNDAREQDAADRYNETEDEKGDKSELEQAGVNTESNIVDVNRADIQETMDEQSEIAEEGDMLRQDDIAEIRQQFVDLSEEESLKVDGQREHIDEVIATNIQEEDERSAQWEEKDEFRQENVEEVSELFEEIQETEEGKITTQLDNNSETMAGFREEEDERSDLWEEKDEMRVERATVIDGTFVQIRETEQDKMETQLDNSSETMAQFREEEDERSEVPVVKDVYRQENIENVDELLVDIQKTEEDKIKTQSVSNSVTMAQFREEEDERSEVPEEKDVYRQENIDQHEDLFVEIRETEEDKIKAQLVSNDVTMEQYRDDEDERAELWEDKDEIREDRVEDYDDLFVEIRETEEDKIEDQLDQIAENEEGFRDIQEQQSDFRPNAYADYDQTVEDMDKVKKEVLDEEGERMENDGEHREDVMADITDLQDDQSDLIAFDNSALMKNAAELEDEKIEASDFQQAQMENSDDIRSANREELAGVVFNPPPNYDEYYLSELAKKYPQGVTEEVYKDEDSGKYTVRRIVVQGNKADDYLRVITKWSTTHFKNGKTISDFTFEKETYSN